MIRVDEAEVVLHGYVQELAHLVPHRMPAARAKHQPVHGYRLTIDVEVDSPRRRPVSVELPGSAMGRAAIGTCSATMGGDSCRVITHGVA